MPESLTVEIAPLHIPDDAAAPDAADFRTSVDIRNRVLSQTRGDDATLVTPEQSLTSWQDQTDEEVHGWLVRAGAEAVGRLLMYVPLEQGSQRAQLRVEILPEAQGRGIGRESLRFLEARAADRGRTTLQSWTEHAPASGCTLTARSGFGMIPHDHMAGFAAAAGYHLEQVYRVSALDLTASLPAIPALLAGAREASDGYRVVTWTGGAPDHLVDDYAWMKSRMSTDAPAAATEVDEETWDAARVRRMEADFHDLGATLLVGAAQHVESGRLAAFSELFSFRTENGLIDQNDTLVLTEHRGHRLGALLKCELLHAAREAFPEGTRIVTGNAEENRPMLAINEAMGFAPVRYSGEWQKHAAGTVSSSARSDS